MDQIKPEFLKKLSKLIVVLIWILSLLVTHNFYMFRLTIQLVTHAIDKNYMFLLCNGLLVFVAKCSGFIASSKRVEEGQRKTDKTFDYGDFESYNAILELEDYSINESGTEPFLVEEVTETIQDCKTVSLRVDSSEEDAEDEETEDEDEEEEEEEEEEFDLSDGSKEEEENVGVVTEEDQDMNKKFDEFIRKMKEELRIEAQQHLILV